MSQQELLRILECPTCFEIMFAPIYICSAGHSICHECKVKIRHCPTCRGLFNIKRRNHSLEHLSAVILHPCPHEGNGCTELTKYVELSNHATICCFRPYDCVVQECEFKGPIDAFKKHVEEKHAAITWRKGKLICHQIVTGLAFETEVAFLSNPEVMFIICQYQGNNPRIVYWTCQYVGKSEDAANFIFSITIADGTGRLYSFTDRCQPDILTPREVVNSGHCLAIPVKVLQTFMGQEKVVTVDIQISDQKTQDLGFKY